MKKKEASNHLDNLRHSCAHLLAAAVMQLYPNAKRTIGPAIESGFYFDFDFGDVKLTEADLERIESVMKEIAPTWVSFEKHELTADEAKAEYPGNEYKHELIEEFTKEGQKVTFYKSSPTDYWDLCRGGHVDHPSEELKHFKLLSLAGAYWRGDEHNTMLTRIYGTIFPTQKELEEYLWQLEEAKKRDHRRLGKELDLFTFSEEVGPGLVLWTPKGTVIRDQLENWAKATEEKWGYVRVSTPHIAKHTLFEISGHLPYYKDDMYAPMKIDEEDYYLKGMNCPHHHMIYLSSQKSYRDLPLRYAEYGTVYRYEQSGTLFGLMRVRAIAQNDAHIYCREDDAQKEFLDVLKLHEYYYQTLGLTKKDYRIVIGLPDEKKRDKYHGDKALWEKAERMMRGAIEESGIEHIDDVGGAAFYGPKVDFNIRSSIGREFSISTCQLDLYMPTRFHLEYVNQSGEKENVAVIHRAPLGSHERFIGFLIEHFGGAFPTWLSPNQVTILPITDRNIGYAQTLSDSLKAHSVRVTIDDRSETLSAKIRDAQIQKTPYMIIVGDRDEQAQKISIRSRSKGDLGSMELENFVKQITEEINGKLIV
jgi:threonyl-tRNA synthetase